MTSGASSLLLEEARTIDRTFHTTIVDAMGNSIVSDAYQVNSLKLSLIRQERGQLTMALLPQVMHDHLNIINALEKRDAPGAVVAMTAHIKRGLDRSLGNLDHWSAPHEMDRSVLGS
jgi:DNA-binding GntR family transcriptional regulator